jgi:protein CLEC16A
MWVTLITLIISIAYINTSIFLVYIFAHAFMNELISFDFDFGTDDELVDYFVSFLKSLTLKLNEETVNFFFNDKFKTFPLYHQAVRFYNHRESMVRTSVRTITLTIYNSMVIIKNIIFHFLKLKIKRWKICS